MAKHSILGRIAKIVVISVVAVCGLVITDPTANVVSAASSSSASSGSGFLGFPTWYRNLPQSGGTLDLEDMEIGKIIIIVALNCSDMALRVVSIIAVCFIVWGGIQFILARGEPGNVAKARKTITFAVIGLIIGMLSALTVGFISGRLS